MYFITNIEIYVTALMKCSGVKTKYTGGSLYY